jgi:hypothetical protein
MSAIDKGSMAKSVGATLADPSKRESYNTQYHRMPRSAAALGLTVEADLCSVLLRGC